MGKLVCHVYGQGVVGIFLGCGVMCMGRRGVGCMVRLVCQCIGRG